MSANESPAVAFLHPIIVQPGDIDFMGHVNNAVFLTFLETGRDRFFHSLVGDTFLDLVLVRLEIDFKAEIPMGTEEVLVTCRATGIGRTSRTGSFASLLTSLRDSPVRMCTAQPCKYDIWLTVLPVRLCIALP